MKIWIDADAAPRDVKEVVFKAANREGVETVLVANQRIPIPANAATVSIWILMMPPAVLCSSVFLSVRAMFDQCQHQRRM